MLPFEVLMHRTELSGIEKIFNTNGPEKIFDIAYDHDQSIISVLLFISNNVNILFDIKLPVCH